MAAGRSRPLPPLVPPLRFALVDEGIFRGAYPSLVNQRFLSRLQLRTVISLLPEAPTPDLVDWCEQNGIRIHAERVAVFKDEVTLTHNRAADILTLLVRQEVRPVYVHCLDGVSVTGTIVMCLRKLQRWTTASLIAEYARFARRDDTPVPPKPHIVSFFQLFRPEMAEAELSKLTPAELPPWLTSVRSVSPPGGVKASLQYAPPDARARRVSTDVLVGGRSRATSEERGSGEEREGEADAAPAKPLEMARMRERAVLSSGLHALALEGLTMGPKTHLGAAAHEGADAEGGNLDGAAAASGGSRA